MRKNIMILTICAMIFSQLIPTTAFAADDLKGHYFEWDMRVLIDKGIMGGYGEGTFLPNNPVTRAEMTAFLVRALGLTATGSESAEFTDVNSGDWYYSDIKLASTNNIVGGYPDGSFKPNKKIPRQEMAAMISKALDYKGVSASSVPLEFVDTKKIDPMFRPAIQQLLYLNVIAGKERSNGDYFLPLNSTSRGEAAALLNRMLNVIANPKEIINYTNYDYSFDHMVNKQMNLVNSSPAKVDGAGKYIASRQLVAYYANPSNFKKGTSDYLQFLVLSQSANLNEKEINEKVLKGKGTLAGQAAAFIKGGEIYNINEVYLLSHALHETGNGSSPLAKGIKVGLNKDGKPTQVTDSNKEKLTKIKTTYNMFGIGATDGNPNKYGSERAYNEGWFTPKDAIIGGAKFIGEKYIMIGQDTLYKIRWNPEKPATHQYATHVMWSVLQTDSMQEIYSLLDSFVLKFDVPKFTSQPEQTSKPTGIAQYYVDKSLAGEKGKVIINDLNFREGPTTGFNSLGKLSKGTAFTLVGENGSWYKIDVNGTVGWVSKYEPGNSKVKYVELNKDVKASSVSVASIQTEQNEAEEAIESSPSDIPEDSAVVQEEKEIDVEGLIGEIKTDDVVLKSEASDEANIIKALEAETKVEILEITDDWVKVVVDNTEGWILTEDVEYINLLQIEQGSALKAYPDQDSETIDNLTEDKVIVASINAEGELLMNNDWYQISLDGQLAWVYQEDVTFLQ